MEELVYRRRRPEGSVLSRIVQAHLESFRAEARERSIAGRGYPRVVEEAFRRSLRCGILA